MHRARTNCRQLSPEGRRTQKASPVISANCQKPASPTLALFPGKAIRRPDPAAPLSNPGPRKHQEDYNEYKGKGSWRWRSRHRRTPVKPQKVPAIRPITRKIRAQRSMEISVRKSFEEMPGKAVSSQIDSSGRKGLSGRSRPFCGGPRFHGVSGSGHGLRGFRWWRALARASAHWVIWVDGLGQPRPSNA